jgi:hypothetical protein
MYAHCGDLDLQLMQSCKSGDLGDVESLLKKGARVNFQDDYGWTPLSAAAKEGHTAVVEYLLKQGADPNIPNSWGWFPISWAALQGHAEVVELLIKSGARPDAKTGRTWTAETLAKETGARNVLRVLDKPPRPSARSSRTPAPKAKRRPPNEQRSATAKHKTPKNRTARPAKKSRVSKRHLPKTEPSVVRKPSPHGKPAPAHKAGHEKLRLETKAPKKELRARATKPARTRVSTAPKWGASSVDSLEKKMPTKEKQVSVRKGGSALKAARGKSASSVTGPETIGKPKLVRNAGPGSYAATEKPRRKTAKAEPAPTPTLKSGREPAKKIAAVTTKNQVHRYRDKMGSFSVTPPPGWTRKDFPVGKRRSMVLFHEPKNRNVSITVIALPKVKSRTAFFKAAENKISQLKSMFPKGRFKLRKSKPAEMDALVMEITIPGTVRQEIRQLRGPGAAYTITYLTSTEPQFEEFLPMYKKFLKSFKPLGRGN